MTWEFSYRAMGCRVPPLHTEAEDVVTQMIPCCSDYCTCACAYVYVCICVNILSTNSHGLTWLSVALPVSELISHPKILWVIHICPNLLVQLESVSIKTCVSNKCLVRDLWFWMLKSRSQLQFKIPPFISLYWISLYFLYIFYYYYILIFYSSLLEFTTSLCYNK